MDKIKSYDVTLIEVSAEGPRPVSLKIAATYFEVHSTGALLFYSTLPAAAYPKPFRAYPAGAWQSIEESIPNT